MAKPYYVTTAINYPNGRPHIGHAYEAIAADVIARFQRQMGRQVRFQTGTDEHGLKMARKAADEGRSPRALADEMAGYFRQMDDLLGISYDRFIRTVEDDHHLASQALWRAMEANGDLYLDRYEGWYSIRDEAYYDESELSDDDEGTRLSPQGTLVEWTVEESWFFRLSRYQDRLLTLYDEQPEFVSPAGRRNEMIAFVSGGLRDLSVSRTSFDWGVRVPGSDQHVMYVWVDALTNYLTGLGYPKATDDYRRYWPADLHLVGKDIVRFHAVYWPAFLMSAGLPLPRQIFGHGFILNRGQKESKTLGNVTDPIAIAQQFGVDNLRFFLMREVSFGQDGSYADEALVNRTNAELANSFGNLVQRSLSMIHQNMEGRLCSYQQNDADRALLSLVSRSISEVLPNAFTALNFSVGLEAWLQAVFACNQYIDEQAPWALKKTDPERMQAVLMTLFIAIRHLAFAVQPVIPETCKRIFKQLGVKVEDQTFATITDDTWFSQLVRTGHRIGKPEPVIPRLELPETQAL